MFYSNVWPNWAHLWDIRFQTLLRSLKVKFYGTTWLLTCSFLLVLNSNIWPNWAPFQDIMLWYLSVLDFDASRSLKVKYDDGAIELLIYCFLLINRNIWPHWAPLWDIRFQTSVTLNVTFWGHSRSNLTVSLISPNIISNSCIIVSTGLFSTLSSYSR